MARFDTQAFDISAQLLEQTFLKHPDYLSYGDINLLHTMNFLKSVAFHKDLGPFHAFDQQIEEIGLNLLKHEPNNPYPHIYLGSYYDGLGKMETAATHFQSIVDLKNFSPHWYTREARNWLNAHE